MLLGIAWTSEPEAVSPGGMTAVPLSDKHAILLQHPSRFSGSTLKQIHAAIEKRVALASVGNYDGIVLGREPAPPEKLAHEERQQPDCSGRKVPLSSRMVCGIPTAST